MEIKNLNKYIDHTLVKRDATTAEIDKAMNDAIAINAFGLCITPTWISHVKGKLHQHGLKVVTVIGFPFGVQSIAAKIFEGKEAVANGADELDFIINVGKLHDAINSTDAKVKHDAAEYIRRELHEIRKAIPNTTIKIIFESALLNEQEIHFLSKLAVEEKWDFLKTSTAVGCDGAKVRDVEIMHQYSKGTHTQIKASGGIRTFDAAKAMIQAGATRLGTSNGDAIVKGKDGTNHY